MKRLIDHSFNYRKLDNVKPYKDGMTHQEYYLYYWGCAKPGLQETKWSVNENWYNKHGIDIRKDIIEVHEYEPVKIKDIPVYSEFDAGPFLEYKTTRYEKVGYNFSYREIDQIRRKHPIPDKFMFGSVAILMGRMEELEDPISALMHSDYLDYLRFEKALPLTLYLEEHTGIYILRGWRKIDDTKRKD